MLAPVTEIETLDLIVNSSGMIEGLDRNALKDMIIGSMFNDHRFIMADIENKKLRAFIFATIETLDGEDVCFVQACGSNKPGVVQVMLDKMISWSKELGLKRIVFMTKRSPRAWERKYKFSKKYYVMERAI